MMRSRLESGQPKADTTVIKYRLRFLSAKPVRGAFARILVAEESQKSMRNLSTQLQGFVDRDFGDYVVVAVTAEAADREARRSRRCSF